MNRVLFLLALLLSLLAGCAVVSEKSPAPATDGGIVGTGNRMDCEEGKSSEQCRRETEQRR
jgi:hypothetical protein